jgi:glycosyltransferase involved in cell wall biosynthesis
MALRVLAVGTRYPHWGAHSGFQQFLKHLDPGAFSTRLHLAPDSDDDFPARNRVLRAAVRRLVQRRMPWYKLSDLWAEIQVVRRRRSAPVDVVHFMDGEHCPQYLPRLVRFLPNPRPKVVATFHQPAELLEELVIREVVKRLDLVTLVSPEQAAFFDGLLPRDRVRVILHGVDADFFSPAEGPRDAGTLECLTVGHYFRDFAAVRAVAVALGSRPEIRFRIVSSWDTGCDGLPNVSVHSGVSDAELRQFYRQAEVLFLPLREATANNALLEGMASGLPVVSTDLPSVRAYLGGGEAILVAGNDPAGLSRALLDLLGMPDRRRDMGRAARRQAGSLAWPRIAAQYADLYEKMTKQP